MPHSMIFKFDIPVDASMPHILIYFVQISAREDVAEVSQARFWEMVPGHVVGSLSIQVIYYLFSFPFVIIGDIGDTSSMES